MENPSTQDNKPRAIAIKQIVMWVFLLCSLGIIAKIVIDNYQLIVDSELTLGISQITLSAIFCTLTLFTAALLHSILLTNKNGRPISRSLIIASYGYSQIVRYIPGKIIGIISQSIRLSGESNASAVWEANFTQFIITNLNCIIIIASVFAYFYMDSIVHACAALLGSLYIILLLGNGHISKLFDFFYRKIIPHKKAHPNFSRIPTRDAIVIFALLQLEWLFYFLSWYFLLGTSLDESLIIGTLYISALLISLAAIIVPGGFMVREAIFVSIGMAMDIAVDKLIIYGITIRLLMLFSEIIFFILAEINLKIVNRKS